MRTPDLVLAALSGSTSANPGAAFVGNQPVPATGTLAAHPGNIETTTTAQSGAAISHPGGTATEERAGSAPPR